MAEPFTSTASGGPRSYRGGLRPSPPQDSLLSDVSLSRRDGERMERMQAEVEVQSCLDCCDVLVVQCGHLFCIGKMPVLTRVLVLWFWVLALTILLALLTVYVALGPTTYSVSPTDSMLVADRISSVMCGKVTLESASGDDEAGSFSAYLMDSQPSVDQHSRQQYEMKKDVFLDTHQKQHWKYNLLQGSVIRASVCSDDGSTLYYYIIKGHDNLRAWQSNPGCSGCYVQRLKSKKCSDSKDNSSLVVRADDPDDYFVAIHNQRDPIWPIVDINVNRSLYDTTLAIRSCEQGEDCTFPLNFAVRQYVLFHAEKDWAEGGELTTRCRPRVWMYVDVFLLVGLVLGVSLSLLVCRCAKNPGTAEMQIRPGRRNWRLLRRLREGAYFTERSPLLGGRVPPPSSYTGGMQPPDYDDVVSKEGEDHPPPPYTPTLGAAAATAPAPPPFSSLSASTETSRPSPTQHTEPQDPPVVPIVVLP